MTDPEVSASPRGSGNPSCRLCDAPLTHTFVNLGMSPLANRYLMPAQLNEMEPFYPLHAWVCDQCFLVQLEEFESPASIFTDYAYFSSYSDSWLEHARSYVDMSSTRFGLGGTSQVVEIASNDGYLLQYFMAKGIPVLGVEPAANVAAEAISKGIPTVVEFFGEAMARRLATAGTQADLLVRQQRAGPGAGPERLRRGPGDPAAPGGVITMEFPHLLRLIEGNQFDTIYHEHFSYFSFISVERVFARHGLTLFDVEELPTHGGSLRIYARHADGSHRTRQRADRGTAGAGGRGRARPARRYCAFAEQVQETKRRLLEFLIDAKRAGKTIAGYGAPGKGNTLLNYCGIRTDFLEYTVDRSPHKQGRFLPGTHIPIFQPDRIRETQPDYVLILPWNLKEEIMEQMAYIRDVGRPASWCRSPRSRSTRDLQRDTAAGRVHHRARAARGRARLLRAHVVRARGRGARAQSPTSPSAASPSTSRKGTLRGHALPGCRPHAEAQARALHDGRDPRRDRRPPRRTRRRFMRHVARRPVRGEPERALYVPEGFAHGFQTLADDTEVFYQMSESYVPEATRAACAGTIRPSVSRWPLPVTDHLRAGSHVSRTSSRPDRPVTVSEPPLARAGTDRGRRRADARSRRRALSDLPEHHRRRGPGDPRTGRRAGSRSTIHEVPTGTPRLRLDGAPRVEHPRRLRQELGRRARHRLPAIEPPRRELQRAGRRRGCPLAELAAAPPHACPTSRTGSRTGPRTTTRRWGFCLSQRAARERCPRASTRCASTRRSSRGHLDLRRVLSARGDSPDEVLISCHVCHPSLANDNLSGIAVAAFLGRRLAHGSAPLLVPVPVHPGHDRLDHLAGAERGAPSARIRHGLVLACLGDAGRSDVQEEPARRRRDRPRRPATCSGTRRGTRRSWSSRPTGTTSASTARRASTCRSAASCGRRTGSFPSTTRPRTTWTSSSARGARDSLGLLLEHRSRCSRETGST